MVVTLALGGRYTESRMRVLTRGGGQLRVQVSVLIIL